ncbi:2-keto-4-pentenoate hydratase [Catalinimonas niigatensis]|uniref:2-keto-4-pentenoate hydratase n=1 Tax=Catalinimonas niigatensis TaxID=1397264 RepID=UPI002665D235|nr:hypothetical protein [Catalinimonas niigatensis]WPP49725.1 hypothetical protein PZB72_23930 [Catalinimonas niigatensis]
MYIRQFYLCLLLTLSIAACTSTDTNSVEENDKEAPAETGMLVDSVLYYRQQQQKTDILSRHLPEITREQAIEIQLAMLQKELAAGEELIGWKMGGTIASDSAQYDPVFGYILSKNLIKQDSVVSAENFPGGEVLVEGEVGFVLKNDFRNGVSSIEELKEGIDYVVGAVEFAQSTAIPAPEAPDAFSLNHTLATGMGQAGLIIGSVQKDVNDFEMHSETVQCFIDGELAAEGSSSRVYTSPLHALFSLANMLPQHGNYLKQGDIVVTGSLYANPTIDSTCQVRLEYNHLGNITFSMK